MENNEILRALLYKTIYRVKRFITLMICMESSLSLFNTSLIIYCNAILRSFKNRSTKDRNSSGNISTSNRYAKGAVFLRHEKNEFEPVGEENFYAIVELKPKSVIIALCDDGGNAKAISQYLHPSLAEKLVEKLKTRNIRQYQGTPYIPL